MLYNRSDNFVPMLPCLYLQVLAGQMTAWVTTNKTPGAQNITTKNVRRKDNLLNGGGK